MEFILSQAVFLPLLLSPLAYILGRKLGTNAAMWFTFGLLLYCTIIIIQATLGGTYEEHYQWTTLFGEFGFVLDGLAAPFAGNLTFEFVKKYVDDIINVSENEMIESIRVIIERLKVIPEAAASACFVPILKNKLSIKKNTNSIIVLCGGNIDLDKLKKLF